MTKNVSISFNAEDENVLMAIFKKFNIKIKSSKKSEDEIIQQRLNDKYVLTGIWSTMSSEDREDAAHAETLIYRKEVGEKFLTKEEVNVFLTELENL